MSDPITIQTYLTPAPMTVGPEMPLVQAKQRMMELRVRHMPVVSAGRLVGILSDRDAKLIESLAPVDESFPVERAMQPAPFTVGPHARLAAVAQEMAERKIGTAVVVDPEHPARVLGIFTTTDALHAIADLAASR